MRTFRKILPDEVALCKQKFEATYPWGAEPRWEGVWVMLDDGEIVSFCGFQTRTLVEPLYAESASAAKDMCVWADGALHAVNEYEFFVPDRSPKFQHAMEHHFGLEGYREIPGKIYQINRSREVCHSEREKSKSSGSVESQDAAADATAVTAGHADSPAGVSADSTVCTNADAGRD